MKRANKTDFWRIAMPEIKDPAGYVDLLLHTLISMSPFVEIEVKTLETKKVGYVLRIDTHPSLQGADGFYSLYFGEFKRILREAQPKDLTERFRKAQGSYPNDKNYKRAKRKQHTVAKQITNELQDYLNIIMLALNKIAKFKEKDAYPINLFPEQPHFKYVVKFIQDRKLGRSFSKKLSNNFKTIPLPESVVRNHTDGILISQRNDLYNKRLESYCAKFISKKRKFLQDLEIELLKKKRISEKHFRSFSRHLHPEMQSQ